MALGMTQQRAEIGDAGASERSAVLQQRERRGLQLVRWRAPFPGDAGPPRAAGLVPSACLLMFLSTQHSA